MQGYVKLHRAIFEHPFWLDSTHKKSLFEAWVYLIGIANHKDNRFLNGSRMVTVKRGQHLTSQVKLSRIWNRDRGTVKNYLEIMKTDGMIDYTTNNNYTLITICNYEIYQEQISSDSTAKPASISSSKHQRNHSKTRTNNNEKTENNEKKYICEKELKEVWNEFGKRKDLVAIHYRNHGFTEYEVQESLYKYGLKSRDEG